MRAHPPVPTDLKGPQPRCNHLGRLAREVPCRGLTRFQPQIQEPGAWAGRSRGIGWGSRGRASTARHRHRHRHGVTGTVPTPRTKTLNVVVAIFRRDEGLIAVASVELWGHTGGTWTDPSTRAHTHTHTHTHTYTADAVWAACGAGSRLWTAHMTTAVLVLVGTGAGTCEQARRAKGPIMGGLGWEWG